VTGTAGFPFSHRYHFAPVPGTIEGSEFDFEPGFVAGFAFGTVGVGGASAVSLFAGGVVPPEGTVSGSSPQPQQARQTTKERKHRAAFFMAHLAVSGESHFEGEANICSHLLVRIIIPGQAAGCLRN
jgi:hypothetical protein